MGLRTRINENGTCIRGAGKRGRCGGKYCGQQVESYFIDVAEEAALTPHEMEDTRALYSVHDGVLLSVRNRESQ